MVPPKSALLHKLQHAKHTHADTRASSFQNTNKCMSVFGWMCVVLCGLWNASLWDLDEFFGSTIGNSQEVNVHRFPNYHESCSTKFPPISRLVSLSQVSSSSALTESVDDCFSLSWAFAANVSASAAILPIRIVSGSKDWRRDVHTVERSCQAPKKKTRRIWRREWKWMIQRHIVKWERVATMKRTM